MAARTPQSNIGNYKLADGTTDVKQAVETLKQTEKQLSGETDAQ